MPMLPGHELGCAVRYKTRIRLTELELHTLFNNQHDLSLFGSPSCYSYYRQRCVLCDHQLAVR